jgi:hypothetical protein
MEDATMAYGEMMGPGVVLGRDGMGNDADESDFDAWVAYVCDRIDTACGFAAEVESRVGIEVQSDRYYGTDEQRATLREAVASLWNAWCSEGAPTS